MQHHQQLPGNRINSGFTPSLINVSQTTMDQSMLPPTTSM
jgi:hypothetical protein